jgi:hypothetical protein
MSRISKSIGWKVYSLLKVAGEGGNEVLLFMDI